MEIFAYGLMAVALTLIIGMMGWQVGCWFTEAELARRTLEQQRQEARKRTKAKSKARPKN